MLVTPEICASIGAAFAGRSFGCSFPFGSVPTGTDFGGVGITELSVMVDNGSDSPGRALGDTGFVSSGGNAAAGPPQADNRLQRMTKLKAVAKNFFISISPFSSYHCVLPFQLLRHRLKRKGFNFKMFRLPCTKARKDQGCEAQNQQRQGVYDSQASGEEWKGSLAAIISKIKNHVELLAMLQYKGT